VIVFDQILQSTTMLTLTKEVTLLVHPLLIAKQDHLVDFRRLPQMPGEQRVSLWRFIIDCQFADM